MFFHFSFHFSVHIGSKVHLERAKLTSWNRKNALVKKKTKYLKISIHSLTILISCICSSS